MFVFGREEGGQGGELLSGECLGAFGALEWFFGGVVALFVAGEVFATEEFLGAGGVGTVEGW